MRRALALGLWLSLSPLWAAPARADEPEGQAELLRRAEAAEQAFEPAQAEGLYREALARDPGARLARRARARLAWLEERREGGYAPLAALMRVRGLPARERAATIAAFEAEVASFPEGRVKRESLAIIADTYLDDLDDAAAARAAYRRWLASPGLSEAERQLAASGDALAGARLGDTAGSVRALEAQGLGGRAEAVFLRSQEAARTVGWAAIAVIAAFVAAGVAFGGGRGVTPTGLRAAFSWPRVAAAAYVLLPPLVLTWLYDWRLLPQAAQVVLACAAAIAVAAVFGAGATLRGASRPRQRVLAGLAAAATLAAAFLALAHSRLLFDVMMAWEEAP